jgi:hypothetical protein
MIHLDIAERLGEDHVELVRRIVECLGEDRTNQLLQAAIDIHGKLARPDGQQRSLGGCFFYLAKEVIPKPLKSTVFPNKSGKNRSRGRALLLKKFQHLGISDPSES